MQLVLHHDDDRSCPKEAVPSVSVIESGGQVDFTPASYPTINPGAINYPVTLIVSAYNAESTCYNLGALMDRSETDFNWYDYFGGGGNGHGADGNMDWTAGNWVSFTAGTGQDPNRDCIEFQAIKAFYGTNGVAKMAVNYLSQEEK